MESLLAWFWDSNAYYRSLIYMAVIAVAGYYLYRWFTGTKIR